MHWHAFLHRPETGGILIAALSGSLVLGIAAAAALAGISRRSLILVRQAALALLVPAAALAIWPTLFLVLLPGLQPGAEWHALRITMRLIAGTLPVMLLPVLAALIRMPAGQMRAAAGLGAGRPAMLLLVWLPQLGPLLMLGWLLTAAIDLAALLRPA
jgi:ABC-type spermidine/putrescine transport system permease subunit II